MVSENKLNILLDDISLVKCLSFFVLVYLAISIISIFFNIGFNSLLFKALLYLPMLIFFIVVLKFPFKELKKEHNSLFKVINFQKILFIILVNILFTATIFFILTYLSNLGFFTFNSSLFGVLSLDNTVYVAIYFFVLVILSPIVEEILFRGIILRRLIFEYTFDFKWAILVSSILFGLCHSFGGILSAFVFGICMSILYIKSKNILVPILGHFINNLISFIFACLSIEFLMYNNFIILLIVFLFIITNFILFKSIFKEISSLSK